MLETSEAKRRSMLQVALGFLMGILICVGCFFFAILIGATLGLRHTWMFPVLNAIALVASGAVALRKSNQSNYPDGVLIAVSVGFILNFVFLALTQSGYVE